MESRSGCFEFGPYRIHAEERVLYRNDEVIPLPPKVADTLVALLSNAGRMVEKGDLMKSVWPDTFVEEGALARNISFLRKTLGSPTDESAWIETIPRRGYRFVAPVRVSEGIRETPAPVRFEATATEPRTVFPGKPTPRRKWQFVALGLALAVVLAVCAHYSVFRTDRLPVALRSASLPYTSLAVVPCRNDMNDPAQDYVADGMTQALITNLSKLNQLRVVSMDSGIGDRGEAIALDAAAKDPSTNLILRCTVLRTGGDVQVYANLRDPRTGVVYLANAYKHSMKDVSELVAEVSKAIAKEVPVGIAAQETQKLRPQREVDPAALDAYWRGRYYWNLRTEVGLEQSIGYFRQSIAADPQYALAYTGLADSYSMLSSIEVAGLKPTVGMPLAKTAALSALELDPNLADAHVSLAYIKLAYEWDMTGAQQEFARAIALEPASANAHHWYSHYFLAIGDFPGATAEMHKALLLEPLSPSIGLGLGWCYYYAKLYDQAIRQFRAVVEMNPGYPLAHQTLGMAYRQRGRNQEAIDEIKRAFDLTGGSVSTIAALATAYAAAGRLDDARRELAHLDRVSAQAGRYVPALYFGQIHLALGDMASFFKDASKAVDERTDYLIYLSQEPDLGPLSNTPEFIRLLNRLH